MPNDLPKRMYFTKEEPKNVFPSNMCLAKDAQPGIDEQMIATLISTALIVVSSK